MAQNEIIIKSAPEMMTEWQECYDAGLDVEKYRTLCEQMVKEPDKWNDLAWETAQKMSAEPMRADYPYEEPSDYEAILAARPKKRHHLTAPEKDDALRARLQGAWTGRIAGCLLGKPVEGMRRPQLYTLLRGTDNYPMHKYIRRSEFTDQLIEEDKLNVNTTWADNIGGIEPVDDDTNYTVFGMKLIERWGRDFKPADVLTGWMCFIPFYNLFTAERAAYRNGAIGLTPPETAVYQNPYREWIGAQIRGDFFGYINPGNPEGAASMAFRDASISHIKNGIYGEMFCSAMIAAAAVTDDIMTIIEAGLDEIPEKCRLRHDVELVIDWWRAGLGREAIIEKIHGCYDENTGYGWCHTNSNAMIVTMALLLGEGDFGTSVCGAVQAAFDTDCNGATVGSIIGMRNAFDGIPAEWKEPFGGKLRTTIQDYNLMTVEDLVEHTMKLI